MNRTKKLIWLMAGAATAVLFATCAPIDSSRKEGKAESGVETSDGKQAVTLHAPRPEEIKAPHESVPAPRDPLQQRIELAIDQVRQRDLLISHGFWTVFHGIVGLGPSVTLLNPETGQRLNALDYICGGGEVRGMNLFPTRDGLDVQTGPQFVGQGHQDQFIAELAQWGMPADRKFNVLGKEYTYMDFARHTKARSRLTTNQELSWAIIVLGQYFGTDITWKNRFGERLRFEDVVRYEIKQPINGAACGGTHRLFGLTWVYYLHLRKGGKTTGVWKDLVEHTARYQKLARKFQNADGSFSTNFFRSRGNAADKQLRMNTTGHILEWLALSLPDAELKKPWMQESANALAQMFLDIQGAAMEGGTLYHAVHGLIMYYARVYGTEALGPNKPYIPLPPR